MFGLESLVIFVIIWWLIFFITLPFGVSKDEEVIYGNDPGAPKKTLLKKKNFSFNNYIIYFNYYCFGCKK